MWKKSENEKEIVREFENRILKSLINTIIIYKRGAAKNQLAALFLWFILFLSTIFTKLFIQV